MTSGGPGTPLPLNWFFKHTCLCEARSVLTVRGFCTCECAYSLQRICHPEIGSRAILWLFEDNAQSGGKWVTGGWTKWHFAFLLHLLYAADKCSFRGLFHAAFIVFLGFSWVISQCETDPTRSALWDIPEHTKAAVCPTGKMRVLEKLPSGLSHRLLALSSTSMSRQH